MDAIIEYLNDTLGDNYIYIIGIAAIVLFILVGFLASRKGPKKEDVVNKEEPMANINEVSTGEINQVADTLQQGAINPVELNATPTADALVVDKEPVVPVNNEVLPPNNVGNQMVGGNGMLNNNFGTPGTLNLNKPGELNIKDQDNLVDPRTQAPVSPTEGELQNTTMPIRPELSEFEKVEKPESLSFDVSLNPGLATPDAPSEPEPLNLDLEKKESVEIVDENPPKSEADKPVNVDYTSYVPDKSQHVVQNTEDNILNGEETPVVTEENKPL